MPCPILSCESRESCYNVLPQIKAIGINDASIEIQYFTTKEDSENIRLFGFYSEFLYANYNNDCLALDDASIKIKSGIMLFKNKSNNEFNSLNVQSGVLSGNRIIIYNPRIKSHKRMDNKKNIKKIIHALLGLSISTIYYCKAQGIEMSSDIMDFGKKKVREYNLRNQGRFHE